MKKQFLTLISVTFATLLIAIWQQWDLFFFGSLYWFEGVVIAFFASLLIIFYESIVHGLFLLAMNGVLFGTLGIVIFEKGSDFTKLFNNPYWSGALSILVILELLVAYEVVKKYGKPFNKKLADKSDPILIRVIVHFSTLMTFFLFSIVFEIQGIWALVTFILANAYFEWKYLIKGDLPK